MWLLNISIFSTVWYITGNAVIAIVALLGLMAMQFVLSLLFDRGLGVIFLLLGGAAWLFGSDDCE